MQCVRAIRSSKAADAAGNDNSELMPVTLVVVVTKRRILSSREKYAYFNAHY